MTGSGRDLVEQTHQQALEQLRKEPLPEAMERPAPVEPDLPPALPGAPFAQEWEVFRREVGRLLAEGGHGKFALIKVGQPITVWDTLHDAVQAGEMLYGTEPCLVQQILPHLRSQRAG